MIGEVHALGTRLERPVWPVWPVWPWRRAARAVTSAVWVAFQACASWGGPPVSAADGHELHVVVRGDLRAPRTLVLVHGNFDSLATWDRLVPFLEAHFRIVTLDLPGFGTSPNTRGAYGVDALAAALDAVFEAQHLGRAVLVGNSLGGAVVSAFAAAHPEKVEALVLEDANLVRSTPTPEARKRLSAVFAAAGAAPDAPARAGLAQAIEAVLRLALPTPAAPEAGSAGVDAALVARYATAFDAAHWSELKRQQAAFTLEGLQDRLVAAHSAHPFPILVVWGVDDPLIRIDAAERLMPRLGGARAVYFAGAGHAPHLERPRALADVLVAAFAGRASVKLPAEDVLVAALDGTLPQAVDLALPRLEAARIRAFASPPSAYVPVAARETREAGPALERGCAAGDFADCFRLGALVLKGYAPRADGVADHDRGFDLLEQACRHAVGIACTMFAGWNRGLAPKTAARLFMRACALGDAEGCYESGRAAEAGRVVMRDSVEAARRFARACELGDARGCEALIGRTASRRAWLDAHAPACLGHGPFKDVREAMTCEVVAWTYLGLDDPGAVGEEATVPRPDPARAAAILLRDCDLATGSGNGCGALAPLLAEGRGVARALATALRIERARCEDGASEACLHAGLWLVPTDRAAAESYLMRGVQTADGALTLAKALLAGDYGLARDPARAAQLLDAACVGGRGEACVMADER